MYTFSYTEHFITRRVLANPPASLPFGLFFMHAVPIPLTDR